MDDKTKKAADSVKDAAEEVLDFTETAADEAEEVIDLTETAAEEAAEKVKKTGEAAEKAVKKTAEKAEKAADSAKKKSSKNNNSSKKSSDGKKPDKSNGDKNKSSKPEKKTEEPAETEEPKTLAEKLAALKERLHLDILGKIAVWVLTAALFLGVCAVTIYYVTTASKAEFHADCTDTIIWAEASVESGHTYDKDFSYACFLPFSTSTIMIPLIHMFGYGMTAHIVGMMCFFVLLTVFMLFMIRETTGSFPISMVGTAIFLSITLSTQKMREIFWGHTIYYSLGILFLLIGAFLYFRLLTVSGKASALRKEGKDTKKTFIHRIIIFLCICAFMVCTGLDGITGFTLFVLPFAGAVFAEQFVDAKTKLFSSKTFLVAFRAFVFLVMAVIGNFINKKLLGDLSAGYQEANSNFSPMEEWLEHFQKLPFAWMRLLGVRSLTNVKFASKDGIPNMLCLMTAILIAVLPIVATCFYKKFGDDRKGRMMRIWIWMHWAVTAVNIMGYVFGVLSAADWRIIPMIGTSLIVSILFLTWSVSRKADVARLAVVLFVPIFVTGLVHCNDVRKMKKDAYKTNTQFMLADFLEEQGVTKGYATFWNANSVTLITNNKIKVFDINVDENGATMRTYQSSRRWYETDPYQKDYFLLLSDYEYSLFQQSNSYAIDPPQRIANTVINNVGFTLLVYDHNIIEI
ncbi:hypothetical protein [Ruminococcus flavefaciens]|uniref:hypothetical protein n=1 Tax=Ruminococcus flavefaciens TaxID=1265 RepID=UPI00048EE7E6|nr:hypothetical protein [Ruminococcus flavefaciens]